MADDAVYDAVRAYLENPVTMAGLADPDTSEQPTFRWENEDFTLPNPPQPFVSVSLSGVMYGQESIGASRQADNRWDETGRLWLSVLVGSGTGASRARQLAKQLANQFRGLTLLNDALEFMDAFIGQGAPGDEDGNWFELPLIIEWRRVEA